MTRTALSHGLDLPLYELGPQHPMTPVRYRLAVELVTAYGLLDRDDVHVLSPRPATVEEITRVHPEPYVTAIRRFSENPALSLGWDVQSQWGITPPNGDTPAVPGLHDRAAAVCGTTMAPVLEVWEGRAEQAIGVGGGLHHAFAHRAQGFCVYNDPAVAIQMLLDAGAERVAFVDVDAHHGDGVQWIFYEDPRVLTCSVHESGKYLFPGTGFLSERGQGEGFGYSINVPLPPFAGDEPYIRAVEEVVIPAVRAYRPDALVIEPGWDGHHSDILSHLQISMNGFERVAQLLRGLAAEVTDGRFAAVGGGGYTGDVLPRGTALFLASMLDVELDDDLPPEWRERVRELTGREADRVLREDGPLTAPADDRRRADAEAHEVIDQAIALLR
jgi:acetoin utilization protein AcuC